MCRPEDRVTIAASKKFTRRPWERHTPAFGAVVDKGHQMFGTMRVEGKPPRTSDVNWLSLGAVFLAACRTKRQSELPSCHATEAGGDELGMRKPCGAPPRELLLEVKRPYPRLRDTAERSDLPAPPSRNTIIEARG